MASPLAFGDDAVANDCANLQSILSDGHYIISADAHSALESVIVTTPVLAVSDGGL